MKHKKFMILAFCLFLFVSNVFSQQINFDSYKTCYKKSTDYF